MTLLVLGSQASVFASIDKYTIAVCMTLSLENAFTCKKRIYDNMDGNVFIVKDKDGRYYTYLDIFDNKKEARDVIKKASYYVKQQKPYVKVISEEILSLYSKKKTVIDLNEIVKKQRVQEVFIIEKKEQKIEEEVIENKINEKQKIQLVSSFPKVEELKLVSSYPFAEGQKLVDDDSVQSDNKTIKEKSKEFEELKQISMDEFDKADDEKEVKEQRIKQSEELVINQALKNKEIVEVVMNNSEDEPTILNYEELIIEVNANTNLMTVNAKINNELKEIKEYRVSTAKKDVRRPFGEGKISKISLNPIWYPTQDTLKSFRKRGINLPSVVPPGHKYNYMGAAKINLTHMVNGKNTYRIHGTLSEKTIGTNESAGCIRMKNSDVLQLAALINDFSQIKSLNNVKVILK
ncbi:MAG: L,D-transpeptidase family protein [Aliarcobacter sp.]|nr:L,D-transpeptidase family protein [Aliarcobacter sp.]